MPNKSELTLLSKPDLVAKLVEKIEAAEHGAENARTEAAFYKTLLTEISELSPKDTEIGDLTSAASRFESEARRFTNILHKLGTRCPKCEGTGMWNSMQCVKCHGNRVIIEKKESST